MANHAFYADARLAPVITNNGCRLALKSKFLNLVFMKPHLYFFSKCTLTILLLLLFNCSFSQQVAKSLTAANGQFIGFYEYKPVNYTTTTKYPLIIFLHGWGERGNGTTELPLVTVHGIPKNIKDGHNMTFTYNSKQETFLVLSPQLSTQYGSWELFYVDEMIKYATTNLSVDPNRIFLTGLSLGGGGTWRWSTNSSANASKLAAIAPVCGTGEGTGYCNLTSNNLGIWAFHAMDDGTVGVGNTQFAQIQIGNCQPGYPALYTYYPSGGHGIWDRSYATDHTFHNPNLYEWFLSKSKAPAGNQPPVAKAGNDINITWPVDNTTLNGSGSNDPDGSIVSYTWSKVAGPTQFTIANTNTVTTPVTALVPGTYKFRLEVKDNLGLTAADTVDVIVTNPPPVNQLPVAKAGNDQTITLPVNTVTLDGSASSDADGTITNYNWSKIAGPVFFNVTSTGSAITTVTSLAQGTYSFQLTVTDNSGATAKDTVNIVVLAAPPPPNVPPVANAGTDQAITLPVNNAVLDGSASTDVDGTINKYVWNKIAGPASFNITNVNIATTSVTGLVQGNYSFQLIVTDNNGATAKDTVNITVFAAPPPPNLPPVAKAGPDQLITLPLNSITLDGTASLDADGTITTFLWKKIAGPALFNIVSASSATTAVNNVAQGIYLFQLTVTDNQGSSALDTMQLTVNAANINKLPVAKAGNDITLILPGDSLYLDGFNSFDADGTITSYQWSKIAGPAQYNLLTPNNVASWAKNMVPGFYQYQLKVVDNNGGIGLDTVVISVYPAPPPPNQAPVARAGNDVTITLPNNAVVLNGSASTDGDGTIVSYGWSKLSGPASYNFANATNAITTVNALVQGTYLFTLTVTDNNGATSADTLQITVLPAPPVNQVPVANAGADILITLPVNTVTLNGSLSTDVDGTITNYAWSKIAGPTSYNIINAGNATTNVNTLVAGVYLFQLSVTDNNGAINKDTVQVQVLPAPPPPNVLPVANAGNDVTITLPLNTISLNGSLSYDSDGSITNYTWSKIAGPANFNIANATNVTTNVTGLVQGNYLFELKVTDNNGAVNKDTIEVKVLAAPPAPNQPPVAKAGNDVTITLPVNSVTLDGTASFDADGNIVSYAWTKIAGPLPYNLANAASATTTVNILVQGNYLFELKVTDNNGAVNTDTIQVKVLAAIPPPNQPPVAIAGNDSTVTLPNAAVNLTGAASYDTDGNIIQYSWAKIAGPGAITIVNANTANANVVGLTPGEYIFEITVTDNDGAIAKDQIKITVKPAVNKKPKANAGKPATFALPTTATMLDGSASTDEDGTIVSYQWKQVSGPVAAKWINEKLSKARVEDLIEGLYEFELTVTDDKGDTGTDTVKIEIQNNFRTGEILTSYPNPAISTLNIRYINNYKGRFTINIYDVAGKVSGSYKLEKQSALIQYTINVDKLLPGLYYLEIIFDGQKKSSYRRFIKK
jgi:Secretion system C-terminal sorting domain/PKD domain